MNICKDAHEKLPFGKQKTPIKSGFNAEHIFYVSIMYKAYKKIFSAVLRMTLSPGNSLFRVFAVVDVVSAFIPVYRSCGKAKTQAMARTRSFYSVFFFRTSVCKISATTNYFTPSKNFSHGTRAKALRCSVFKMKDVSLFQSESAVFRFAVNYFYTKSPIFNDPFVHLLSPTLDSYHFIIQFNVSRSKTTFYFSFPSYPGTTISD